ncbi:hypothetical protein Tco_1367665 [Tanacetum coccineum]
MIQPSSAFAPFVVVHLVVFLGDHLVAVLVGTPVGWPHTGTPARCSEAVYYITLHQWIACGICWLSTGILISFGVGEIVVHDRGGGDSGVGRNLGKCHDGCESKCGLESSGKLLPLLKQLLSRWMDDGGERGRPKRKVKVSIKYNDTVSDLTKKKSRNHDVTSDEEVETERVEDLVVNGVSGDDKDCNNKELRRTMVLGKPVIKHTTNNQTIPIFESRHNLSSSKDKEKATQSSKQSRSRWRISKENIDELRRSANKFSILEEIHDCKDPEEQMLIEKEIMDKFVKNQRQPTIEDSSKWTAGMFKYFKEQWKSKWINECLDEEDVFDEVNGILKKMTAWNVRGMCNRDMQKDVKKFIRDEKLSICVVLETRIKEKKINMICGSCKTSDMIYFQECHEHIEVDDLNSSGIHFTWIQSRQDHSSGILKKIDRVLGNIEFVSYFSNSHALFLPHLTFDQSPAVLIIPKVLNKKHKAFRFLNFIADKPEFINMKVIKLLSNLSTIFHNFFGKVVDVQNFNLETLKSKTVCVEGVEIMVMHLSDMEIKEALFDICDNKAPGLDGYSAKFFKCAWSVIKNEVCDAVKEFFRTGKILGEINATLITLVPKSKTPKKVSDYRPIACCNTVYKVISKILTNWIKSALCTIGEKNGQEEWLKIDITTAFTISINNERSGYFKGGRGLRQGDPISPNIFTLVMEVFTLILWWGPVPLINNIPMEAICQVGLDPNSKIKDMISAAYIVLWGKLMMGSATITLLVENRRNGECRITSKLWRSLKKQENFDFMPDNWDAIMAAMTQLRHNRSIKSVLRRIILAACIYFIWNERNKRLFTSDKKDSNDLTAEIVNYVRLKLTSLTVKMTSLTEEVLNPCWGVLALGGIYAYAGFIAYVFVNFHKEGFLVEKGRMNLVWQGKLKGIEIEKSPLYENLGALAFMIKPGLGVHRVLWVLDECPMALYVRDLGNAPFVPDNWQRLCLIDLLMNIGIPLKAASTHNAAYTVLQECNLDSCTTERIVSDEAMNQIHDVKIASLKQRIQELEFPQLQQDLPTSRWPKTLSSYIWDVWEEGCVGKGGFGVEEDNKEDVVVVANDILKVLDFGDKKTKVSMKRMKNDFEKEVGLWKNLDHPNVTKCNQDVTEEEEGCVGKGGFGVEEDNKEDVVVVANDFCSSMIQTILSVDFEEDINTKSQELMSFKQNAILHKCDVYAFGHLLVGDRDTLL